MKEPVLRAAHVQMVGRMLLRRLQNRLDQVEGPGRWWCQPAWRSRKHHAASRDSYRLFWRHRMRFSQRVGASENMEQSPQLSRLDGECATKAAEDPVNYCLIISADDSVSIWEVSSLECPRNFWICS